MRSRKTFAFARDLGILGALSAACACAYFFWIDPNLEKAKEKGASLEICQARERSYQAARMNHFRTRRTLEDLQIQVEREGGGMPPKSMINERIATITAIAQANDVIIEEVDPGQTLPVGQHLEAQIHFRARTTYTAFRRFLFEVERQLPFVDITHFSVRASSGQPGGSCRTGWWVRMYFQEDELVNRDLAGRPTDQLARAGSKD